MEESHKIDNLVAARDILRSSIEKSRNASKAIDQAGCRLKTTSHNLAFLQAGIREIASGFAIYEINGHIDRAIGPAAAVLKVFDAVNELQDSLETDPINDVSLYLTNIRRLEQMLKLLANNCRLVILWLEDVVRFLETNTACTNGWYLMKVSKVLKILQHLQQKEESFRENGGVLSSAFDKLEAKYRNLLTDFNFPAPVIEELQAITEILASNNRLDRCISIYTDVQIENARVSLRALNADYLDIQLSKLDSSETVEFYIDQWDEHMEFAVRHLLRTEHRLCSLVFQKAGTDISMSCFAKIATQCGFNDIFGFGKSVTKCKKEAIKLLKLLKIFATLDKLRLDFNELFSGKFCIKIQNQTRDLVRNVVNGACEIFWELLVQVELQRESSPPSDGSVPRLVCFVTEYCNQLLDDENSSILARVLEIHQDWNNNTIINFEKGLLCIEIQNIMKALETNLESWAERYDEKALSCLFMMNNHFYLCNNTRGTLLGYLMGDSWLFAHEKSVERYSGLYLKESWEKLLVLLHEEGLTLFPGGRAIDRGLVKNRIGVFCEAFDDMYRKQSKWILGDKALRYKTCQLVFEAIVPPYESYLQRFMPGLEQEIDSGGVKYSGENLENLIGSLFELKLGNYGGKSSKCTDLIGIKNAAAAMNHFSSTPAAA